MEIPRSIDELEQTMTILPILAAGQGNAVAGEGEWSVLDVVYHMLDEEVNDFRAHILQAFSGEEWTSIDPDAALEAMRATGNSLEQTLNLWQTERAASVAWLRGLDKADWSAQVKAPWRVFSAKALLANWAAHDCHHLRQLVELKYARVAKAADGDNLNYAGDW